MIPSINAADDPKLWSVDIVESFRRSVSAYCITVSVIVEINFSCWENDLCFVAACCGYIVMSHFLFTCIIPGIVHEFSYM